MEIYGTLGPACTNIEILEKMFKEGMTGMRLNMSHSSLKESQYIINKYHSAAKNVGCKAELLIDMQGPELRIGLLKRPLLLVEGENICFVDETRFHEYDYMIPVNKTIFEHIETGNHILLDDGKIELEIIHTDNNQASATILRGGELTNKKSIKIIDKTIQTEILTPTDIENIKSAHDYGVTALMQPFVRSAQDLREVKKVLKEYHSEDLRLFAKIESREGIENLEEIIDECDMVVIARGDLGNDMPLWELPLAQDDISDMCKKKGRDFLVVTQMLTSMIDHPIPTRAEISDIYRATKDGAKAIMVTNETAIGQYPVEVITYLYKTVEAYKKRMSTL